MTLGVGLLIISWVDIKDEYIMAQMAKAADDEEAGDDEDAGDEDKEEEEKKPDEEAPVATEEKKDENIENPSVKIILKSVSG